MKKYKKLIENKIALFDILTVQNGFQNEPIDIAIIQQEIDKLSKVLNYYKKKQITKLIFSNAKVKPCETI